MSTTPITNAGTIIRTAIADAVAPLMTAYQYSGHARLYWMVKPDNAPLPYLVYQPQAPINLSALIGDAGADVLIALRAIGKSISEAETLLGVAVPGMSSLAYTGYTLKAEWQSSNYLPPLDNLYTVLQVYRVRVRRA